MAIFKVVDGQQLRVKGWSRDVSTTLIFHNFGCDPLILIVTNEVDNPTGERITIDEDRNHVFTGNNGLVAHTGSRQKAIFSMEDLFFSSPDAAYIDRSSRP